jgi:tetratricopeptide (TPR) repeat protein
MSGMKTLFLLLTVLSGLVSSAQKEPELMRLAERFETAMNENAAFETYKKVIALNPSNYMALWKLSELCSRVGNRQLTAEKKKEFFINGRRYAEAAIKVNPAGADGYYALAVSMGRLALIQGGKDRINAVKDIRSNAETAIRLNPAHGRAWHVMGKWHYEVSGLNFFEKTGVRLIYGGFPPASIEESIQAYEKARQLEPHFALNFLELAKAYNRSGQKQKAIEQLKKLPSIPNKTADDNRIKNEGAQLLRQLSR